MKKIRTIEAAVLEEKKLRVSAYCRVSTDQTDQQNSLSAQVQHYTDLIKNNPSWDFAGIYVDDGISGKNAAKRPEFTRMVKDAENKKFDLILTKSISRFARNTRDCLETVRKLKQIGIGIYFEKTAKGLDNIKTISGKDKWDESTVRDIIKNEKYVGDALLQKTITKDFKKKRNKGEVPMYYVKDTHPAIINREDFEKAQELMAERAKSKGNIEGTREKYLKRYAFTSTIECGHCGRAFNNQIH